MRIACTFHFLMVGVLVPLAEAAVSVFCLSTFDTDSLLVREQDLGRAVEALGAAGDMIQPGQ